MKEQRLDRTAFFAGTHEEVEKQANIEDAEKSYSERLRDVQYLNSVAYNYDLGSPPILDRSFFEIVQRNK